MKEDVLKELPPKITQDYYCELSPLQKRLYEDFSRTHMPNGIEDGMETQQHIFQALRYLQNVCNHPKLVLTSLHPEFAKITHELAQTNSSLNDIQHAAKLPALRYKSECIMSYDCICNMLQFFSNLGNFFKTVALDACLWIQIQYCHNTELSYSVN